ncbi:hypothetical protein MPER_08842, partial [Moniliophthora perniciosa FA553]
MDECIHTGVSSTATTLPGRLGLRRRAPALYRRLMRGFYPGIAASLSQARIESGQILGVIDGPLLLENEEQSAVNEVNASGGRIVTSPTNGAAGVIPAVLKYIVEFVSDDPHKSVMTFLLTASAIGMLFKRGSTISAAEGGCQAETYELLLEKVGVACSMASAGFAACMG